MDQNDNENKPFHPPECTSSYSTRGEAPGLEQDLQLTSARSVLRVLLCLAQASVNRNSALFIIHLLIVEKLCMAMHSSHCICIPMFEMKQPTPPFGCF